MIDELLGCVIPMSAKSQKETFQAIVEETLGDNCDFETVKNIHENLSELVEETKDEPVPLTLDKYQVKKLLETNGAPPEKLEEFEQRYAEVEDGPAAWIMTLDMLYITDCIPAGMPIRTILWSIRWSMRTFFHSSLYISSVFIRALTTRTALSSWDVMVARAAPATPIPSTATSSTSRIMLVKQLAMRKYRGRLESPMARRIPRTR